MKIQHYAIIFIMIILPFSLVCKSKINNKIDALNNETRINNALDVATMDAIDTLIDLNNEYYAMYDGQTINVTPDIAREGIKVFFESLAVNEGLPFTSGERSAEAYFSSYIPAIVVVAYDGFYIYSMEQTASNNYEYVLSPKIPYAYKDEPSGCYIHFTLGNEIKLYTKDGTLYEGEFTKNYINESIKEYAEISDVLENNTGSNPVVLSEDNLKILPSLTRDMSLIMYALNLNESREYTTKPCSGECLPSFLNIYYDTSSGATQKNPMLNDYEVNRPDDEVSDFNKIRRETIINVIIETLNEKINNHNRYADIMGITYDFFLPTIDNADWINAVDDVSIMAFVQGIPTGTETYYNSYALGASRIIRSSYIYGTSNGLYHESNCEHIIDHIDEDGFPIDNTITDMFLTEVDAALEGFYPCRGHKINKTLTTSTTVTIPNIRFDVSVGGGSAGGGSGGGSGGSDDESGGSSGGGSGIGTRPVTNPTLPGGTIIDGGNIVTPPGDAVITPVVPPAEQY